MADNLRGYTSEEVLNKVLNTSSDSIKVDVVSGAEYAEDSGHTSADTGNFILGVRNDTLAALGGTDGDYVPFQMNASGALYVEAAVESGQIKSGAIASGALASGAVSSGAVASGAIASGAVASGAIASGAIASGALASGSVVDGAMVTLGAKADAKSSATDTTSITAMQVLKQISASVQETATDTGTIDADTNAIKTSVQLLDNAVDGAYLNVNMNLAGSDAQAGEGTISATTQRVTIATDDDGVAHLATIAGAVSTQMQVDVVAISAQSDGTYIGDIKFGESLPAGSAAIGKLAANSGVDIGDVDVTSIIPGTGATNLGKAEDAAHSSGDTGVMPLAVRNDDIAALGGADGDYAPLQVNASGALYTNDASGEAGSIFVSGTTACTPPSNTKFVAIQFIEDSVFDSANDGLISSTNQLYPSTQYTGTDIDGDAGAVVDSVTFPQGMTIFGRWSGFKLASGKVIAYIGYV